MNPNSKDTSLHPLYPDRCHDFAVRNNLVLMPDTDVESYPSLLQEHSDRVTKLAQSASFPEDRVMRELLKTLTKLEDMLHIDDVRERVVKTDTGLMASAFIANTHTSMSVGKYDTYRIGVGMEHAFKYDPLERVGTTFTYNPVQDIFQSVARDGIVVKESKIMNQDERIRVASSLREMVAMVRASFKIFSPPTLDDVL